VGDIVPLGARLRQRRQELGLSQTQAAQQLDVARTAYRLWEMEAARPAPDRWRLIANWLGVSISALLVAGELIDEQDGVDGADAVRAAGLTRESRHQRDEPGGDDADDDPEQVAIARLSELDAARLRNVVARMQQTMGATTTRWHEGRYVKRLPRTELAPALARSAVVATALGIPDHMLDDAELLISELVTNAVLHTDSAAVDVAITLDEVRLRIEIGDESAAPLRPRTPGADGGFGVAIVGALATRWGVERHRAGKTVWVELDVTES
jgi:transcriptional regulator with XRE-family HTH domain/anti-sigma regulatory factor (Ser/Thr protein kinase)